MKKKFYSTYTHTAAAAAAAAQRASTHNTSGTTRFCSHTTAPEEEKKETRQQREQQRVCRFLQYMLLCVCQRVVTKVKVTIKCHAVHNNNIIACHNFKDAIASNTCFCKNLRCY
jgi:hypothetical protein